MKTSRFTDSQIMQILKQAEAGKPVPRLMPVADRSLERQGKPFPLEARFN